MGVEVTAFDFVERCWSHNNSDELLDDLMTCIRPFGFEYLILSGIPVANQRLAPLVHLNGWPPGWFDRYVEKEYAKIDGVCLNSARSTQPFFWDEIPGSLRETKGSNLVANEATEFGIHAGYAIPMQSKRHWQSVVSLASPFRRLDMSPRELAAVTMMGAYAGSAVERLLVGDDDPPLFTPREREVLQWVAVGKTSWETAQILGCSHRSVDTHLMRARAKCGVATTRQAVIEAIRHREIAP